MNEEKDSEKKIEALISIAKRALSLGREFETLNKEGKTGGKGHEDKVIELKKLEEQYDKLKLHNEEEQIKKKTVPKKKKA